MKNAFLHNLLKSTLVMALALSATAGCSKKETKKAADNIPDDTQGVDDAGNVVYDGGTAPVDSFSLSLLETYAGRRINNPKNLRITLDVFNVANTGATKQYGGTFKISYEESYNGGTRTVSGNFNSGTSIQDTRYNKFYNTGGTEKLKLFFQDNLGAIIVSVEAINVNDLETKYKGRVYFRNFDFGVCSNPPPWMAAQCNIQSPSKCWNISAGPYDCRAYMSGKNVKPDAVDLPGYGSDPDGYNGPGYQQLFTITNLDIDEALNQGL
ncbi:MAG: hypothetical protein V4596_10870 [Bdellovibrionota bacterium]